MQDIISPAKTRRPEPPNVTSPLPRDTPIDGSNPALHGYPSATNPDKFTTSTATPDTTTPERGSPPPADASTQTATRTTTSSGSITPAKPPPSNHTARLLDTVRFSKETKRRPTSFGQSSTMREQKPPPNGQTARSQRMALERHAPRTWHTGDVYSPKELSHFEQLKALGAQQTSSKYNMEGRVRTRSRGGADIFDVLRLNPVREYKNFTLMSEFVTETGRIKGARQTGLRAVNQRKLAKAVRRSIGMGLVPSVHMHPELMEERVEDRAIMWKQDRERGPRAL